MSCLIFASLSQAAPQKVTSPDGSLALVLDTGQGNRLSYKLLFHGKPVIERSSMGIVVDGVNLAQEVQLGKMMRERVNETYATRGVHSTAVNNYNGARIAITNPKRREAFAVEVRVFNDGAAFRYLVAPSSQPRVPDEATTFRLPAGSTVWYHGLNGHYEGIHQKKAAAEVASGEWAAPPMTFQLPDGRGYGSITEGDLVGYAGMALQADGKLGFAARLGHVQPPSYPYVLRYGKEEAQRLSQPAAITGAIRTPWRVIMVGGDLNTLVNCDIPADLSPASEPKYFPKGNATEWAKPGRAVWLYLDGGQRTLDDLKNFSRMAGELGFEYNVVEGIWRKWTEAELRDFVDYSSKQHVRVIVWVFSKELRNPETRRALFARLHDAGVAGLKIDFFDHEAKEVVDLYEACLRDAAEYQLVIDFHGANKPTGLQRTWPNELTREAVRGLEGRNTPVMGLHTTTLPFTRLLAGPADFTPMIFGERRKETSWPNQIASAAVLTSPLLVYAANPKSILENPAVDLIKTIPSTWDETIVLPVSKIGEVAAFARRSGSRWFLAILNGSEAKQIKVDLSFLGRGKYLSMLVRDDLANLAAEKIEKGTATANDSLLIDLRSGGGFIGSFSQQQ
jgi:alpha-glucosidase